MGVSDSWCSPLAIADRLVELFGGPVDVDPCSNERSIIQARLAYKRGGLILPWCLSYRRTAGTCYENFPYSKGEAWTRKMLTEIAVGRVREHVRLSMMSTTSRWWSDMCNRPARNPRILALIRLTFIPPPGYKAEPCRFEPALTYIGPDPDRFTRIFAPITNWTTWGRT